MRSKPCNRPVGDYRSHAINRASLRQQRSGSSVPELHGGNTDDRGKTGISEDQQPPLGRRNPPRAANEPRFRPARGSDARVQPDPHRQDRRGRTGMRQILCHATSPRGEIGLKLPMPCWGNGPGRTGFRTSNPPGPKPDALPGCATPRHFFHLAPPPVGPAGFEPAT